jgi:proteasome lid subunit RPN8/RPN11
MSDRPPLKFSPKAASTLHGFIQRDAELERCAVLLSASKSKLVRTVVEVPNRSKDPAHTFAIHHDDVQEVLKQNGWRRILGFMHTHPMGYALPSAGDINSLSALNEMMGERYLGLVLHSRSGICTWYDGNGPTHQHDMEALSGGTIDSLISL